MNTTVIIQARMGSTRLPGKIMADISGKPMLWHVIERVKIAQKIDQIILATTKSNEDNQTAFFAKESDVEIYRGSKNDVLDRYYQAAKEFGAELIVRITADCPLIDPHIIDKMVDFHHQHEDLDYVGMGNPNPCPDGLDTEVFTFQSLDKAFWEAKLPSEREHVTPYIWKNTEKFKLGYVFHQNNDLSYLRWTVDEESDLKFVREIYKRLYSKRMFFTNDVLDLLKREPQLIEINKGIIRNEGYLKSLREDEV